VAAQAQDGAVAPAGDLDIAGCLARVVDGHQVLAAVLGPLHRPAAMARRERDQKIFRIEFAARAKAAADVVLDHVDGVFGEPHLLGEDATIGEQHFCRARHRQPAACRIPFGEHAARLHRQRGVALRRETLAARVRRILEGRRGVAAHGAKHHRDVAAFVLEQQRMLVARALPVGDRGQRLDIDLDGADRILGDAGTVGQHHRQGLAHIAHLFARHDGLGERLEIR